MLRGIIVSLLLGLGLLADHAGAQTADSFITRYRLPSGTVLQYRLKVRREPTYFKKGRYYDFIDSVEATVLLEVVHVDSAGVMTFNSEVTARSEGILGDTSRFTFSELPIPPRAYFELSPEGGCHFASVLEFDSLHLVSKVLSRKPSGHYVPVLKDIELVRRFASYFFPPFGRKSKRFDGEVSVDSSNTTSKYRTERVAPVAGQQDKKLVAVQAKEHEQWYDTTKVVGPGNFNGIPVFEIVHTVSSEGGRFETFAGGRTGHHAATEQKSQRFYYFRINDGALVARDFVEERKVGETLWNNHTTIRLIPTPPGSPGIGGGKTE